MEPGAVYSSRCAVGSPAPLGQCLNSRTDGYPEWARADTFVSSFHLRYAKLPRISPCPYRKAGWPWVASPQDSHRSVGAVMLCAVRGHLMLIGLSAGCSPWVGGMQVLLVVAVSAHACTTEPLGDLCFHCPADYTPHR